MNVDLSPNLLSVNEHEQKWISDPLIDTSTLKSLIKSRRLIKYTRYGRKLDWYKGITCSCSCGKKEYYWHSCYRAGNQCSWHHTSCRHNNFKFDEKCILSFHCSRHHSADVCLDRTNILGNRVHEGRAWRKKWSRDSRSYFPALHINSTLCRINNGRNYNDKAWRIHN